MRLCIVPVVCLRGGKYGALPLFGTGHKYWRVAGPNLKYGELACSHGTFLQAALDVALCLQPPFHSLHIAGPSKCPRVDKPHPASVAGTRPAVGAPGKKVRMWYGMVPVSPTGTTGSVPRICSMGMTYRTGFLWSSSNRT
jgi:hypothetical protein